MGKLESPQVNAVATPTRKPDALEEIGALLNPVEPEQDDEEVGVETEETETAEDEQTSESNEQESSEEESSPSWESVLGIKEEQLSFDDDGNLKGVNVKINGEVSTVKVQDLIAGYQINKALTQKQQAFAEERKAFEAQAKSLEQVYKTKLDNAEVFLNYLTSRTVSEFEAIDWNKLRTENPAEYAAARQDYAERAQELQQAQEAMAQEREQLGRQEAEKMTLAHREHLKQQREKMLMNNPTWNDPEVFKKDMTGMKSFLSDKYGFTDADFAQVSDARLIELIKDAKRYNDGASVAKKKVSVPVPNFQKSVGRVAKPVSKLAKLTKQAKRATGANKRDAQAAAITELLTGGL